MTIDEIKKIKLQLKDKIKSNNINYFYRYVIDRCNRNKYIDLNKLGEHEQKEYLFNTDPDAFISVQDTGDVIGKRFLTWEEEGFRKRN